MKNKIDQLLQDMEENGLEIVSYGLAPNPNGFCFELMDDDISDETINEFSEKLDILSAAETKYLRSIIF